MAFRLRAGGPGAGELTPAGYNGDMNSLADLQDFGFEKTRRAVAALALSFFVTLYLILSANAPEGWGAAFLALAVCYMVAFIGVTAEWFWGRWFASGLGWSGLMVATISTVMLGWMWPLAIYGGLHGLVVVLMLGKRMSAIYDQQEGWRQRFDMDEHGVARLRKTVTRTAASLPSLILWALGPKDPGQGMLHAVFLFAAVVAGVSGLAGVVRLRSWGVVALGASAAALLVHGGFHLMPEMGMSGPGALPAIFGVLFQPVLGVYPGLVAIVTVLGTALPGALLLGATIPFAGPALRFLRRR
jgi:hypothetical protein